NLGQIRPGDHTVAGTHLHPRPLSVEQRRSQRSPRAGRRDRRPGRPGPPAVVAIGPPPTHGGGARHHHRPSWPASRIGRGLLATLPLGLFGLAACGPEGDGADAPTAAPPVEHTEPVTVGERAEVVEHTELQLPLEMTPMVVVDPGWTAVPLQLDGIFLGYREA